MYIAANSPRHIYEDPHFLEPMYEEVGLRSTSSNEIRLESNEAYSQCIRMDTNEAYHNALSLNTRQ